MDKCKNAFLKLKRRFTKEPMLQMPNLQQPFEIEADALEWATGAVLKQ
jgi:hypothetical protein